MHIIVRTHNMWQQLLWYSLNILLLVSAYQSHTEYVYGMRGKWAKQTSEQCKQEKKRLRSMPFKMVVIAMENWIQCWRRHFVLIESDWIWMLPFAESETKITIVSKSMWSLTFWTLVQSILFIHANKTTKNLIKSFRFLRPLLARFVSFIGEFQPHSILVREIVEKQFFDLFNEFKVLATFDCEPSEKKMLWTRNI